MTQQEITQRVLEEKVIAIVRGIETEKCLKVAEALYAGGIRLMEVPFNPKDPASDQTTADCIAALAKEYEGRMLVGAGTVLNTKQVELTAQAGGSYIIAPNVDVNVIRRTVELGMVSMPGAMTPTEIVQALPRRQPGHGLRQGHPGAPEPHQASGRGRRQREELCRLPEGRHGGRRRGRQSGQ